MSNVLGWLGLDRPALLPGFRSNDRSGAQAVCPECGALVATDAQRLHFEWHRRLEAPQPR